MHRTLVIVSRIEISYMGHMIAQLWLPSDMLKTKIQKGRGACLAYKNSEALPQHHKNRRFCQKSKVILY